MAIPTASVQEVAKAKEVPQNTISAPTKVAPQIVKKEIKEVPRRDPSSRRRSALSLKRDRLEDKDFVQVEDLTNKPKAKFTELQLVERWLEFGEKVKAEGNLNTASVLNVNKPVLKDGEIIFALPTKLMEDQLGTIKPKLLGYLRSSLNNYSIQIKTVVVQTQKKRFVYTPQEKFEKLAEDNPDLLLLKSKFGLDI